MPSLRASLFAPSTAHSSGAHGGRSSFRAPTPNDCHKTSSIESAFAPHRGALEQNFAAIGSSSGASSVDSHLFAGGRPPRRQSLGESIDGLHVPPAPLSHLGAKKGSLGDEATRRTMRHILETVHKSLSEHRVKIAMDILDSMFKKAIFEPVLDMPVSSSEDFSVQLKAIVQTECDNMRELCTQHFQVHEAVSPPSHSKLLMPGQSPGAARNIDKRVSCLGAVLGFGAPITLDIPTTRVEAEPDSQRGSLQSKDSIVQSIKCVSIQMQSQLSSTSMASQEDSNTSSKPNASPSPSVIPASTQQASAKASSPPAGGGARSRHHKRTRSQPAMSKIILPVESKDEEKHVKQKSAELQISCLDLAGTEVPMLGAVNLELKAPVLRVVKLELKGTEKIPPSSKDLSQLPRPRSFSAPCLGRKVRASEHTDITDDDNDSICIVDESNGSAVPIHRAGSLPLLRSLDSPTVEELGAARLENDDTQQSDDDVCITSKQSETMSGSTSNASKNSLKSERRRSMESMQSALSAKSCVSFASEDSEVEPEEEEEDEAPVPKKKIAFIDVPDTADDTPGPSMESHVSVKYYQGRRGTVHAKSGALQNSPRWLQKDPTAAATGFFLKNDQIQEDQAHFLSSPSHKFLIHPSSGFRMTWDLIALLVILGESVTLPLGLCFSLYPPDFVMMSSTVFFTPDIIINFFTGFYHHGLIIMKQQIIIKRYLCGWFGIDFLSTVPWEVVLQSQNQHATFMLKFAKIGKLMRVLRLLRILKLKALIQRVEDMCSSGIVLFTISITKSVIFYVLLCHWVACIWGWLGDYDGTDPPYDLTKCEPDGPCENGLGVNASPWRQRYGLSNAVGQGDQYLVSLQFATALLTGAELQMMPGSAAERLFVTVAMVFSFLSCSMIISQIVVVLEKISRENSEYLEQTRTIRDFMVSRDFPVRLQMKVKRYLEYQFKSRKVIHDINSDIMMKVSPFLRVEIQEHMNKAILSCHPFFAGMEASIISQVCCLSKSELYAPGDVVMSRGQLIHSIYFIVRGQLMIKDARDGYSIYLKAPAWTGDRSLFIDMCTPYTMISCLHSEILTIKQQDLVDLLHEFQYAQEYIKEYYERVEANDPSVIFCHFCRQVGHDLDECEDLTETMALEGPAPPSADGSRRSTTPNSIPIMVQQPRGLMGGLLGKRTWASEPPARSSDIVLESHAIAPIQEDGKVGPAQQNNYLWDG